MSAFTPDEIEYLTSQTLARLATVGPDGRPHVIPVTFTFNDEEDAIDVGGMAEGSNVTRAPGAAGSVRQRSAASAA
jgi:pyridoxamine 5'-phosphate oxidase family protein